MESAATLLYSDETLYDGPVFFYDYEDYFPPPDFSSEIPIFSAEDISFLGPASLFTAFGSGDATALSVSKVDSATSSHRPPDLSLLPLPPNGTYQYGVLNHNRIYHPKQQVTDAQYRLSDKTSSLDLTEIVIAPEWYDRLIHARIFRHIS